ncbi:hypothetical protein PFISCL1PPCAC_16441, partial [Pristionchus fissidentatus]
DETRIRTMVDKINKKNLPWIAEYNPLASLKEGPPAAPMNHSLLTAEILPIIHGMENNSKLHQAELFKASNHLIIPSHFDARNKWPQCWSVHQIQNQGGCGSCWATAAAASMSDRFCIASNYTQQSMLSLQDVLTCCEFCGGCGGSYEEYPYIYFIIHGVVTGGFFGSNEGCKPYTIESSCGSPCPPFFHHERFTPKCERKCQPLNGNDYESEIRKARSVYTLKRFYETPPKQQVFDLVKRDLLLHGPLSYTINVDESFMHYRSGIYVDPKVSTDSRLRYGHVMKLIGWGEENGVEYWIVANSYGRHWGEDGFGRISIDLNFKNSSFTGGMW